MGKKHQNVTNINDVEPRIMAKGTRFGFIGKRLGPSSGAKDLGITWYEVAPGKTAFPFHFHCANEEGVFILEGIGEARIGKDKVIVEKGDYIAYPVGPECSHSIKNMGSDPLRYICFSTTHTTEVAGYPDSKKFAAVGIVDPAAGFMGGKVKFIIKEQPSVDYYEGEDVG